MCTVKGTSKRVIYPSHWIKSVISTHDYTDVRLRKLSSIDENVETVLLCWPNRSTFLHFLSIFSRLSTSTVVSLRVYTRGVCYRPIETLDPHRGLFLSFCRVIPDLLVVCSIYLRMTTYGDLKPHETMCDHNAVTRGLYQWKKTTTLYHIKTLIPWSEIFPSLTQI